MSHARYRATPQRSPRSRILIKMALRILAGSGVSSDHDRAQHPPVRSARIEQRPDAVVLEVAEAKPDALDSLYEVVERLGGSVAHSGQVVVADLVEPGADGASEPLDLRRHGPPETVGFEVFGELVSRVRVAGSIEVTQALLDPIGDGHLRSRVAELEQ